MLELTWATGDAYDPATHRTAFHSQTVHTLPELDALLDRLHEQAAELELPHIVCGQHPDGPFAYAMVVGHPGGSFASFFDERGRHTVSFSSAGDLSPEGRDPDGFVFYFGGDWSNVPWESVVPLETARAAFCEFFVTARRPAGISWVAD